MKKIDSVTSVVALIGLAMTIFGREVTYTSLPWIRFVGLGIILIIALINIGFHISNRSHTQK